MTDHGDPLRLECEACAHKWQDNQPDGVSMDAYLAHVAIIRCCPVCGSDQVLMVFGKLHPPTESPTSA